jgi:hypothetical protein
MIFILALKDLPENSIFLFGVVSQVNRAGAKDDIIEGDKAAGSYDKIMITDVVCLSQENERIKSTVLVDFIL